MEKNGVGITCDEAEKVFKEYLGRIWEDSPFNHAVIKYQEEVDRLKKEVKFLKADNEDLRCCLNKAETEARYYQRQSQTLASKLRD